MCANAKLLQDRSKGREIAFDQGHGPNSFLARAALSWNETENVTCFILYSKRWARKKSPFMLIGEKDSLMTSPVQKPSQGRTGFLNRSRRVEKRAFPWLVRHSFLPVYSWHQPRVEGWFQV